MHLILRLFILFLSVLAAFLPMVAYLLTIWWLDRYYRQPLWMVIAVFFWGAFGAVMLGIFGSEVLEMPLTRVFGYETTNAIGAVFVAPLVEEIAKGVILLLLALRMDFSSVADGIVFGAAAGLGFGMTENFLYFNQVYDQSGFQAWLQNIYVRTLYSAVMHAISTSIFGMSLGFVKFRKIGHPWIVVLLGLFSAMGLHAFWNTCMVIGGGLRSGWIIETGFSVLPLLVLVMFVIYEMSLYAERKVIREELLEESELGTIPSSHVAILSSYFKRNQHDWYPQEADRERYIAMTMSLAFKRHQWKMSKGRRYRKLELVLIELRHQLAMLLHR